MTFISKNILDFYENNEHNKFYLTKNFTHSNFFGSFKPFEESPFTTGPHNKNNVKTLDDHNDYYINEFGLRGAIDKNSEIIGAGCSFTFGVGVPENGTWVKILEKHFSKNIINIGLPGYSIESICNTVISYSVNHKMPKKIFCVFPDLFRSLLIEDFDFYSSKKWKREKIENYRLNLTSVNPSIYFNPEEKKMFFQGDIDSKNEKNIEDIMSPHQLIINSINSISLLELFCLSNDIELYWTTWDPGSAYIIDMLYKIPNFKLKKYTRFVNDNYSNFLKQNASFDDRFCNSNHQSELYSHHCWNVGSDYVTINDKEMPSWASHPGIHFQFHLAELFLNI